MKLIEAVAIILVLAIVLFMIFPPSTVSAAAAAGLTQTQQLLRLGPGPAFDNAVSNLANNSPGVDQ